MEKETLDQATYDGYLAQLKRGEMVVLHGRTALNVDHLNFAIRAGGQAVPGDKESDPEPDHHDSTEDLLENHQLEQLQDLAVSLGLTVTGDETADELRGPIREAQNDLKNK